jgi:hypothetical protein
MIGRAENKHVSLYHALKNTCHIILERALLAPFKGGAGKAASAVFNIRLIEVYFFNLRVYFAFCALYDLINQRINIGIFSGTADKRHYLHAAISFPVSMFFAISGFFSNEMVVAQVYQNKVFQAGEKYPDARRAKSRGMRRTNSVRRNDPDGYRE